MKTKKLQLSICALLAVGTMFGGVSNVMFTSANADEVNSSAPAVTYVKTDEATLGAWENAKYGQSGYLIFDGYRNGAGVGFYSDMYNIGATDTTVAETTLMKISGTYNTGWTAVGNGGWDLTKNADGTIAMSSTTKTTTDNTDTHTLKSDAIISSWGVNATTFQGHGGRPYKPYIPGSTTNAQLRMHGKVEDGFHADVNVSIKLNTNEKVNVTVQVHDFCAQKNVATTDTVLAVYDTAYEAGQLSFDMPIGQQTIEACYGEEALATVDITTNGSYVTFTLDGSVAKDYTFVAYREDTSATNIQPAIGGVFFDEYKEPVAPVASFSGYDATKDGTQWESAGYGTDGYIVYYTEDGATYKAYTKGIYKETDGSDYTGLVTYTGATKNAHNEWVANKELSGKLITRYANAFGEFSTIAEKSWKNDYKTGVLTIPGSEDPTWTRISNGKLTGDGVTAFTIPEEAFENHEAVEVTIFHTTAFGPAADQAAPVFTTAIYNIYNCGNGDSNTVNAAPLASATIALTQHTPLYVTYRIAAPGDYSIYLFDSEGAVRATTTGVFFDYVEQGVDKVTYELDGGENNINNPAYYCLGKATALADATKEGFVFGGWYKDAEFTQKVTEISAEQMGALTLYAQFVKMNRTFNVSYITENGTHTNPATYTEGTAVTLTDATKEGYTFDGWYTDIAFTNKVTEIPATQTGDLTLYAKFTKILETFDITYVVDGGTHTNPATYTEGSVVMLMDATKEGYTFNGWYSEETFDNQVMMILSTQTGDVTLYAKFTKNIVTSNITYILDGGVNGNNPATYTEGTAVTLADATKEGYTFEGWYTEATFENAVTEISAEQTGDVTLYAKFVANTPDDSGDSSTETPDDSGDSSTETPDDSGNSSTETPDDSGNSSTETPDNSASDTTSSSAAKGCAGSISGIGFLGLGVAVFAGMLLKKRKEN